MLEQYPDRQPAIGNRIREMRIAAGMSQQHLARPDYSDSYISLIESGKRVPSPEVIQTLAIKLGVSVTYVRFGVDEAVLAAARTKLRVAFNLLDADQPADALTAFEEVLDVPNLTGFPGVVHRARRGKALALQVSGRIQDAIGELEDLIGDLRGVDWEEWARAQTALLGCRRLSGDPGAGVEDAEEALQGLAAAQAEATDAGIDLGVALAEAYLDGGELSLARQLTARLVRAADGAGSPRARIAAYHQAAVIAGAEGDYVRGVELVERAFKAVTEDTDIATLGRLRLTCARLLLKDHPDRPDQPDQADPADRAGRVERARALVALHREELELTGIDESAYVVELARVDVALGRPDAAVQHAEHALEALGGAPGGASGDAFAVLADAYTQLGRYDEAIAALTRGAEHLQAGHLPRQAAHTWVKVAELLRRTGADDAQQAAAYRRALSSIGFMTASQ
jgi:tetratricopeptide (TPR) repeat protein